MATSPTTKAPRRVSGSAIGIGDAPQIAWIACSATMSPPIVTRICFRWLP
jgi:hypothetical protein